MTNDKFRKFPDMAVSEEIHLGYCIHRTHDDTSPGCFKLSKADFDFLTL